MDGTSKVFTQLDNKYLDQWSTTWKLEKNYTPFTKRDTNYRGISLLYCAFKIISNILFCRLLQIVECEIDHYQCGFRQGRATTEQIFSRRTILEKGRKYNVLTHHQFVNFKSAYDNIKWKELYRALCELNVPPKLIGLVKLTMGSVEYRCGLEQVSTDVSICRWHQYCWPIKTGNGWGVPCSGGCSEMHSPNCEQS